MSENVINSTLVNADKPKRVLFPLGVLAWSLLAGCGLMAILAVTAVIMGPDEYFSSFLFPGSWRLPAMEHISEILKNNFVLLAATSIWAIYSVRVQRHEYESNSTFVKVLMRGVLVFIVAWQFHKLAPSVAAIAQEMGMGPLKAIFYFLHGPFELGAFSLPVVWVWLSGRANRPLTFRGATIAVGAAALMLICGALVEVFLTPGLMDTLA